MLEARQQQSEGTIEQVKEVWDTLLAVVRGAQMCVVILSCNFAYGLCTISLCSGVALSLAPGRCTAACLAESMHEVRFLQSTNTTWCMLFAKSAAVHQPGAS